MKIGFAWPGLPDYAARCIRAVIDRHPGRVTVVGTRPKVPIAGMEASLRQPVNWIDESSSPGWSEIGEQVPDILFASYLATNAFRTLVSDCQSAGSRLVFLSDQDWHGNLRQRLLDPIRYRVSVLPNCDTMMVPGKLGETYGVKMGFPPTNVVRGLYGADPEIFFAGPTLNERSKTIVFVGQLIDRKDILGLTHAFVSFANRHPGWRLRICGSGEQRSLIPNHDSISVEDFVQPHQLGALLREARVLALPSKDEHWGLVVHEAALSGCALLLSNRVAAGADLASTTNAILFPAGNRAAIESALTKIDQWGEEQWAEAYATSCAAARTFGPTVFANSVDQIIGV